MSAKARIESLLVANRGEIACRVMRTARRLGMRTIAVYSSADEDALHVRTADAAVCIGAPDARASYLHIERIVAAARASGADAVHPGYGFLSESAPFAQACAQAGLRFVGPPPEAIRALGSKSAAKALLEAAGVPLTPGYHGAEQGDLRLAAEAGRIGFPVLIKASAGGGGKGMRRVDRPQDFAAALAACRREALAAFGSDEMLVEKYILQPRHIEVQIFADTHGNVVHLFERDCSVQRRHQKVLEEAPAPGLSPQRRAAMGSAAIRVARAVGYVGAGTVEFIAPRSAAGGDADGDGFFFMEMNTRLQVEHPVTEMITGLDLVEWQLRVAAGEALPCTQEQIVLRGHAIEARIYAEDADHGFTPATGTLARFDAPAPDAHLRLDAGVAQGDAITPYYDPMIAKLITWDADREGARARLARALARTHIVGVVNNVAFLSRLVNAPSFVQGVLDTDLIEREAAFLAPPAAPPDRDTWLLAALAHLQRERRADLARGDAGGPWQRRDGWRANLPAVRSLQLSWHGPAGAHLQSVLVAGALPACTLQIGGASLACRVAADGDADANAGPARLRAHIDGRVLEAAVALHDGCWHLFVGAAHDRFTCLDPQDAVRADAAGEDPLSSVLAPMPGKVVALLAEAGGRVERDAPLLIVEAMKMEHTVRAPRAGLLRAYLVGVGDQVAMAEQLMDFEPDAAGGAGAAGATGAAVA
jgi:3-methylcrotonyl-CoA carboxylase alpha subunit